MRLEPLYRVRFSYPESWAVGRFRGANLPRRRTGDDDRYRRLNDVVCVCVGEVRAPDDPERHSPDLVIDVAELVWEPVAD